MLAFPHLSSKYCSKNELKKQDAGEDVQEYLEKPRVMGAASKLWSLPFAQQLYLICTLIFFCLTFALPYVWSIDWVRSSVAKFTTGFLTFSNAAVIAPGSQTL